MESKSFCLFAFVITIYIKGVSSENLTPSSNPLAVGGNVTFTLNPQINITAGSWLFSGYNLVFWYPNTVIVNTSYNERVSFNLSTSQISLYSVQVNDSGLYALQGMDPVVKAELTLYVQEPITDVNLTVSKTNLVEFNDSVTFNCTARGTPLVFSWYKGSSEVTAANVQLINDGSGLIISNVTRYDSGPFRCLVANDISNKSSRSISLNISYGPTNLTMTLLPNMMEYISGSYINLSCSCESKPVALFQWSYNGISLNIVSPTFQLSNATQNQTGNYTCIAQNTATLRYAIVTRTINISDPISAALILPVDEPPIFNNSFALTCDIKEYVTSVYWMKDGMNMFPDNRFSLSNQNKTFTFNQLTLSDNGKYQCVASNTVSSVTSKAYWLIVNYGPWLTRISGPFKAEVGSNVTLNCSASSQPASQYSWLFRGSKVADSSLYQADSLSVNSTGEYTCMAYNNITGMNDSATWNLTVIVGISSVVLMPSTLTPMASKAMQLYCNVTGFYTSIQWLKDNQPISDTKSISISNTTVEFRPLQISDDGSYQCVASNSLQPHASLPYRLIVNYGPVNLTITADIQTSIALTCNANSQPPSIYHWLFNNTVVKEDAKLVLSRKSPLGNNYTCVAMNPLTNDTLSMSYVISEGNAATPLQPSVLLTSLCILVLPVLMLMKPF